MAMASPFFTKVPIFFKSKELLNAAGYIDASDNDLKAITSNKKVGLVYH